MKETKSDDHKKGIHEDPPVDINTELEGILQRFAKSNEHQRKEIKRKLREIVEPSSTQTAEPSHPSRLKGRPKGSFRRFQDDWKSTKREPSHFEHVLKDEAQKVKLFQKLNARKRTRILLKTPSQNEYLLQQVREILPPYLAENVVHVTDVLGDGHCGFRVVSRALDMQEDWLQIRKALYRELENHVSLYDALFGSIRRNELLASLDCTETPAPIDKWMSLPDLGLVIASCFNIGVVQLSCNQCFTFLPLYSMPPSVPKMISIGFINGNHFILLELREDGQLPEIFSPWRRYHEPIAETWTSLYMSRITLPRASTSSGPAIGLDEI